MSKEIEPAINTSSDGEELIKPGMLSSPQIAYCQKHYKIIDNYEEYCLSSATYHMRIGGPVVTWKEGRKKEVELSKVEDKNQNKHNTIYLEPNSLSFVTTIEKFNLPKDIIARFNLKSKWVHRGLLLGTGPIVDPELQARLLIPLHNFSSQPVKIKYNQKFISVEFTKTLNPESEKEELKSFKYIDNPNRIFDPFKYMERIGEVPHSSVLSKFDELKNEIGNFKNEMDGYIENFTNAKEEVEKSNRRFNTFGFITGLGTLIGLIVLVITTWMLLSSTFQQLNDAKNIIKQYQSNSIDYSAFTLKKDFSELKSQFEKLKQYTEKVNTRTTSDKKKRAFEIKKISDSTEKKINQMTKQVSELEQKINNQKSKNE